jgi:probable phosphoglycerate mutase
MRHGKDKSLLSPEKVHPFPNSSLSFQGKKEVIKNIPFLKNLNLDLILTSNILRALQTSFLIQKHLTLKLVTSSYLAEWCPATSIYGLSQFDYPIDYIEWKKTRHEKPLSKYKDGESIDEIEKRIINGERLINKYALSYNSILIVSHLVYLRGLIDYLEKRSFNNGYFLFEPNNRVHLNHCQIIEVNYDTTFF